jgi:hypothetical protein
VAEPGKFSDTVPTTHALERVGAAQILAACGMVKVGRVYDLALDLNSSVPQGPPGAFPPFSFRWAHVPVRDAADEEYQFAAETISGTPHESTHIAKP